MVAFISISNEHSNNLAGDYLCHGSSVLTGIARAATRPLAYPDNPWS